MRVLAILLLLTSAAFAKDFTVNDQDQVAVQALCDAAAISPNVSRENRASISAWCVNWQKRMEEANKEPDKK